MKILYVTTVSGTINAFLIPHIKALIKSGHEVDIASSITLPITQGLLDLGCRFFEIKFDRSPINKKNIFAYKDLKHLIKNERYKIIHTHTPIASAIVRLVCKKMEDIKVIYTAHGFHFFKGAPVINWLTYYPTEYWLSKYTDVLITINKEDYGRSKKSFKAKKVEYIPGVGLDTSKFKNIQINNKEKREELLVPIDGFLILSVGELNVNKNHETIIRAIAKLKNPNIYYLICGKGPLENHLITLSKELNIEKQIILLGFRRDIPEICKVVDIFAFPSYREGLPVSVMEAMASGLPIICSDIRGNRDLIENNLGGFLNAPVEVDIFAKNILRLINDKHLRKRMGLFNIENIENFNIEMIISKLEKIYEN